MGILDETLKWDEPSFLTNESKIGSMIRINQTKIPGQYAIYFLCQTSLIKTFKEIYPTTFVYEGNRAILFDRSKRIPVKALKHCIAMALTYKKAKQSGLI